MEWFPKPTVLVCGMFRRFVFLSECVCSPSHHIPGLRLRSFRLEPSDKFAGSSRTERSSRIRGADFLLDPTEMCENSLGHDNWNKTKED